jgi:RNA polymerase sigma-70 factor, ECF subfamily
MPTEPRPPKVPAAHSTEDTSGSGLGAAGTQLSPSTRVESDVGSVAMGFGLAGGDAADRRLLAMAGVPRPAALEAVLPGEERSDAEIMLQVKAGDDSAFAYLVQKYRRPMVNFMYRMAHNAAGAEDLAQEVFLRVYRSRESYEASAKFTTWLYRIATNLAVNHARDTRHERPENTVSLDEPDEESGRTLDLPDGTPNAEENLMHRERLAAIRQRVQALPERQRIAVVMHKYQQMDYHQIADVLKLSESATKSLLFRAYETLREQLREFV